MESESVEMSAGDYLAKMESFGIEPVDNQSISDVMPPGIGVCPLYGAQGQDLILGQFMSDLPKAQPEPKPTDQEFTMISTPNTLGMS